MQVLTFTESPLMIRTGRMDICFDYGLKNLKTTECSATPLDEVCYEFDLSKPIWLDSTIQEFKRHAKARFYQDNFVDSIDFDYLEIQVIEED